MLWPCFRLVEMVKRDFSITERIHVFFSMRSNIPTRRAVRLGLSFSTKRITLNFTEMFDCKLIVLYRKVNLRELKILQREEQKQGMLLMAKIRRQWDAQEQRFEQELQVNCASLGVWLLIILD